jgi:RNA polymerase sigma factor (sigma-70 family)
MVKNGHLGTLMHRLRSLAAPHQAGGSTDVQLLERFVAHGDEAAFEVLVWRHGPMVLNVCRRLLHHAQDAEDAFQATFLTFVRKAGTIRRRETVAAWLYRVACRLALRARTRVARQVRMERHGLRPSAVVAGEELVWRDLRPVLDEAINRLPEKYRAPVVLCYLEGKTHREAARQLGCPEGTVVSRLSRARERLRNDLTRRGLTLTTTGVGLLLAENASATGLSGHLADATVRASLLYAAGHEAAGGIVSPTVAALTEGALRAMFLTKMTVVMAVVLALGILGTGLVGLGGRSLAAPQQEDTSAIIPQKAVAPSKAVTFQWKFEKGKPFYQIITTETEQHSKVMGTDVAQKQNQTFYFRWTPKDRTRDNRWVITQRVEGVKIDLDMAGTRLNYDSTTGKPSADSPLGNFYQALVGSEFQLTVPSGAQGLQIDGVPKFLRELSNRQTPLHAKSVADYNQLLGVWFLALPPQPVRVGDTWSRKAEFSVLSLHGFNVVYQYTYAGKEGPLDKITVQCTMGYQLRDPGKGEGFPAQVKKVDLKTTKGTGVVYFDRARGRIVWSEMTLPLEGQMTLLLNGQETQVDLRQTQTIRGQTMDADPLRKENARDQEAEIRRLQQENERLKRQLQVIEEALKKPPAKK